jgi:diguanylate cyclase (GGDEF)-like protein/PAS domain S-box-containing protein
MIETATKNSLLTDTQALIRTPFLRNVAITALLGAVFFLFFERLVVYPEFTRYLTSITEHDARRIAAHLAQDLQSADQVLGIAQLPQDFLVEMETVQQTLKIEKLKVFAADGLIVYSTDAGDVGQRNDKAYFLDQVAQGRQYTKLVRKKTRTAEGATAISDVVETYVPLLNPQGHFFGAFEIYYDISERWATLQGIIRLASWGVAAAVAIIIFALFASLTRAARAFYEREQAYVEIQLASNIMANAQEGILVTDRQGRIESVNRSFTDISGYSEQDVLGKSPRLLQSGRHDADFYARMWNAINRQGYWHGEVWNRHKNGNAYPEWLTITAIKDAKNAVTHYVGVFLDISHFKHKESHLESLAYRDALTALPNRLLVLDRLQQYIASAKRKDLKVALLFLDLDGFKAVNDGFGHNVGDALLQEAAKRFQTCIREEDTLGRLGGDEFIVLLKNIGSREEASTIAQRLIDSVNNHAMDIDTCSCKVGVSIGISLFPDHGTDSARLMKHADTAMYASKSGGKGRFTFYEAE